MGWALVLDDSNVARRVVCTRLRNHGVALEEVASAGEALGKDLTGAACALLDLELPDGDGVAVAEDLHRRRPGLPVAFFTSTPHGALATRARAMGPVFTKPDDLDGACQWVARHAAGTGPG